MKVKLTAKGVLKIKAENSVESYALDHWWTEYCNDDEDACFATLQVDTLDEIEVVAED